MISQKLNTKTLIAPIFFAVILGLVLAAGTVSADNASEVIAGAGEVAGGGNGSSSITDLIKTIINILSWVAGVISIIMIIIQGLRISVANGDSGKIGSARNGIIYALVGLVVVVFAQVIVRFVLTNVNA